MTNLEKVSDEDLKNELKRREEKKKQDRREWLKIHRNTVVQHVDTLLLFAPKHDRTSCSDEDPTNSFSEGDRIRCERCELLRIKRDALNLNTSVELHVHTEENP